MTPEAQQHLARLLAAVRRDGFFRAYLDSNKIARAQALGGPADGDGRVMAGRLEVRPTLRDGATALIVDALGVMITIPLRT